MKGFDLPRQIAFEMRQGQFPPTPRACHDHGCRCFRLRQVDPVVQEGPFGKFAGICKADPGPYNLAQDGLYEQKTAMAMDLRCVFAGPSEGGGQLQGIGGARGVTQEK